MAIQSSPSRYQILIKNCINCHPNLSYSVLLRHLILTSRQIHNHSLHLCSRNRSCSLSSNFSWKIKWLRNWKYSSNSLVTARSSRFRWKTTMSLPIIMIVEQLLLIPSIDRLNKFTLVSLKLQLTISVDSLVPTSRASPKRRRLLSGSMRGYLTTPCNSSSNSINSQRVK